MAFSFCYYPSLLIDYHVFPINKMRLCLYIIQNSNLSLLSLLDLQPEPECGKIPKDLQNEVPLNDRIVGGKEAKPGNMPWIVSLKIWDQAFCGGTIYNKYTIITAAHCVTGG